ncbi:GMP synthase (glutamine-hydrolyzing) [Renibacterium salmoninarum ATCC 33209]|uniref:GMP synthase (Glutamine-hydrolyzing) n=1 Tax=Renibacterium salmoninarum (strain ATCC 33209 / DSM 20767 / JCM 11484 / NBRC 15589 / NCIMB 2235) TaxID=288705 RepID=A9WMS2_RENSM|nr:type 1 glutamine amidotransferase [Renibacterium salmoninarum]ABY23408.1 GMP synthase (glutamine-hydrolyzing) [Renibacterium salmoninarum ATCC 33209]
MAYVLILKHVSVEGPGLIATALTNAGVEYRIRNLLSENQPILPALTELCGVVLMGGPMDASDVESFPALGLEQQLVRNAVAAKIPVLGVCLGHQIIALALGARIDYRATRKIGVAPVQATGEFSALDGIDVVHWHTDNASLPDGATKLASTSGCSNQAFRLGSALGMQFHLELSQPLLEDWLDSGMAADLLPGTGAEFLADFARQESQRSRLAIDIFSQFAAGTQATHGN